MKNYINETPEETENFDDANFKEETRLEELFKLLAITDYQFTPREGRNAFEGYDVSFNKDSREYIVEAKVRSYTLGSLETQYLTEKKAVGLMRHWKEGKSIVYIQFFTDGAIIYNLTNRFHLLAAGKENHQLVVRTELVDNNTCKDRGKSLKQVYDLSPSEGLKDKVINYKVNPMFFLNKKLLK